MLLYMYVFFFSSRRRHTRYIGDWSSDVCSSDLAGLLEAGDHLIVAGIVGVGAWVDENPHRHARLPPADDFVHVARVLRSEERRVGKECRSRWWSEPEKKKRTEWNTKPMHRLQNH